MKAQNNKRSTRVSSKKVTIRNRARGLTSQAGLVSVVTFLRKSGLIGLIKETADHERGANALYDSVDAVFLIVIAAIGGARALSSVTTIWADGVEATDIVRCHFQKSTYSLPERVMFRLRGFPK